MESVPNGALATTPLARAVLATVLVAALTVTSLIHSNERATAQSPLAQPAPSMLTVPLSNSLDSGEIGPFAFGYVEFDWDPAGGVPGFSSWPPGERSK
jgi:hypothetical protein